MCHHINLFIQINFSWATINYIKNMLAHMNHVVQQLSNMEEQRQ